MSNQELYHWGIKGQKWGIRRFQNKDGSLTPAGKKRYADDDPSTHDDYTKAHSSKSVKSMSDKELQDRLNRLANERRYAEMTAPKISAGRKMVSDTLKSIGNELLKDYGKRVSKAVIDGALDRAANSNPQTRTVLDNLGLLRRN